MPRFPLIAVEEMYYEQRRVFLAIMKRRKVSLGSEGKIGEPYEPMVYAPGVLDKFQNFGEYCRFSPLFSEKLRELAIMIGARHAGNQFVFHVHAVVARRVEMAEETIQAIAAERRPESMDDEEAAVHDFCAEMFRTGNVSDAVFDRTAAIFSKEAVLDLVAIANHYWALSMMANVAQLPITEYYLKNGYVAPFPDPEG